jgi:hypothetical protein
MQYFENLEILNYSIPNYPDAKLRNIFNTLKLDIDEDFIQTYRIDEVKRLDQISYELYETTNYWWIIALLNDINDIIFDIPVSDEVLMEAAKKKTLEEYETIEAGMDYYLELYEQYQEVNESKRVINVVIPSYISRVITEIVRSL